MTNGVQKDSGSGLKEDGSVQTLTPREIEVVNLLAFGFSYVQIAQQLGVTVNTLKTHLKRAYRKLKVHNRTQAVLAARRHGFLPEQPYT